MFIVHVDSDCRCCWLVVDDDVDVDKKKIKIKELSHSAIPSDQVRALLVTVSVHNHGRPVDRFTKQILLESLLHLGIFRFGFPAAAEKNPNRDDKGGANKAIKLGKRIRYTLPSSIKSS